MKMLCFEILLSLIFLTERNFVTALRGNPLLQNNDRSHNPLLQGPVDYSQSNNPLLRRNFGGGPQTAFVQNNNNVQPISSSNSRGSSSNTASNGNSAGNAVAPTAAPTTIDPGATPPNPVGSSLPNLVGSTPPNPFGNRATKVPNLASSLSPDQSLLSNFIGGKPTQPPVPTTPSDSNDFFGETEAPKARDSPMPNGDAKSRISLDSIPVRPSINSNNGFNSSPQNSGGIAPSQPNPSNTFDNIPIRSGANPPRPNPNPSSTNNGNNNVGVQLSNTVSGSNNQVNQNNGAPIQNTGINNGPIQNSASPNGIQPNQQIPKTQPSPSNSVAAPNQPNQNQNVLNNQNVPNQSVGGKPVANSPNGSPQSFNSQPNGQQPVPNGQNQINQPNPPNGSPQSFNSQPNGQQPPVSNGQNQINQPNPQPSGQVAQPNKIVDTGNKPIFTTLKGNQTVAHLNPVKQKGSFKTGQEPLVFPNKNGPPKNPFSTGPDQGSQPNNNAGGTANANTNINGG